MGYSMSGTPAFRYRNTGCYASGTRGVQKWNGTVPVLYTVPYTKWVRSVAVRSTKEPKKHSRKGCSRAGQARFASSLIRGCAPKNPAEATATPGTWLGNSNGQRMATGS